MTWVRLDDRFPTHRKALAVGPVARDMYICLLCYCSLHRTDGFIPKTALKGKRAAMIAPGHLRPDRDILRLIRGSLVADRGDSYQIHDYLDWQKSSSEIEALIERKRQAGRIGGQRSGESRREAKLQHVASSRRSTREAPREPISSPISPYSPPSKGDSAVAVEDGRPPKRWTPGGPYLDAPDPARPYVWESAYGTRWEKYPQDAMHVDCPRPHNHWRGKCLRADRLAEFPAAKQCPAHRAGRAESMVPQRERAD